MNFSWLQNGYKKFEDAVEALKCEDYLDKKRIRSAFYYPKSKPDTRVGIVAAQRGKEIISPLAYAGTMDSSLFEFWFEKQLLPALPSDAVIVMDNASFHRRTQLISIAQKHGFRLIFLPPYSPQFNPIENFWAWLKCYLRSTLACFSNFDDALFDAFQVC